MAIWNPKTQQWDNDDQDKELWNPKTQQWSSKTTVKKNKKKKKEETNFIDKVVGAGGTALKTAGNIATNMGEGALRGLEKVMDFSSSLADKINNPLQEKAEVLTGISTKEKAKKDRKKREKSNREFIATDYTDKLQEATGFNDFQKEWEKGSLVKESNLGGQISQAIGGMIPSLLVGKATGLGNVASTSTKGLSLGKKALTIGKNVGKAAVSNLGANAVLGASSYGGALQEAYQNGASDSEATKYALGSSATELATEWITGGIPGIKSTGFVDKAANKLIDKATGKVSNSVIKGISKTLLNGGYEAVGEGLEEGISEIITPILKNATYSKNEKVNWNDVFQSVLIGGITGGILNAPSNVSSFKTNINDAKSTGTLPTGKLNNPDNQVKNSFINENKSPVSLPKAIPTNISTNNNANSITSMNQVIQANNSLSNVTNTFSNPLLDQNPIKLPAINNVSNTNSVIGADTLNQAQNSLNNQISDIPQIENISDIYQYKESDNNKINNLRKSAEQYLNNSTDSKSFIETAEKVINDKDYNIVLDSTITNKNGNPVNAQIKTLENGEVEIKINPNSDRAGEFLLTHEITHSIETKEMNDLVMDYASKNKDFNNALESLKETYNTSDISDEVLADISGQLFGNQEFINNLSIEKPSLFKEYTILLYL